MRTLVAIAALCLARTALAAGELSASAGFDYSSGSYGGPGTTQVLSIPLGARYEGGPWILRGTLPYLTVTGTGAAVIPGVGPVGRPPRTTQSSVSGPGDATASAAYMMYSADNRWGGGLTGKVKLPTGDETSGLGTGSTDFSALADVFRSVGETTFFAGVGYTMFGSSPVAQLDDVASVSLGLVQRMGAADRLGLALDARQAGTPSPAAQRELSAFWIHRIDRAWRVQAYVLKGFADGSPDWGTGLSAGYAF